MYSTNLIADYFIALSNETQSLITNLKLQKLVYYAQAWHLAINGKELIDDDFEAWVHGPVIPSLYVQYRDFGWKPIAREDLGEGSLSTLEKELGEKTSSFLEELCEDYFGLTAYQLEKLTHEEDPWRVTRGNLAEDEPSHAVIDRGLMASYYSKFL